MCDKKGAPRNLPLLYSLAQNFGKQLAGDAALSRQLGSQGVEQVQRGLYNTIGQASGYKVDKGTDLFSALKKQKLDGDSIEKVGDNLESAAKQEGLRSDQMSMLKGLWDPIADKLD